MIEPVKEVLDGFADAQGWDADTREHVLLQFLANAENGPGGAAEDLRAFLRDLTAGEEEQREEEDPREQCYGHVEQLLELITSGRYEPSAEQWVKLEQLLARTVARVTNAGLLDVQQPPPDDRPRYYVTLSFPIPQEMAFLPGDQEKAIVVAFETIPGTLFDGTGSGMGFRDFFGTTREPGAVAADLTELLPPRASSACAGWSRATTAMPERAPLPVARNRINARRTLRLRVTAHPHSREPDLVDLTIYNSIGRYGYNVAMTRDEAQTLVDALQTATVGPPDA